MRENGLTLGGLWIYRRVQEWSIENVGIVRHRDAAGRNIGSNHGEVVCVVRRKEDCETSCIIFEFEKTFNPRRSGSVESPELLEGPR